MMDISTVGAEVVIRTAGGNDITIRRFSEEGTPFECPDVDLSDNRKNLNGEMISSRMPAVYTVSVTVIPNTDEDIELQRLAQKSSLMSGSVAKISEILIDSIMVKIPEINHSDDDGAVLRTFTWSHGRMKSAPTGPSSSAEGRLAARTYTFEMERYDMAGRCMSA